MLRKATLLAALLSIATCLVALAQAQNSEPASAAPKTTGGLAFRPPGTGTAMQLAQNGPTSLADRLKAIRGTSTSDEGRSSRRRTSNSDTSGPAAAAPAEEIARGPDLPSVLVKRRGRFGPAPVVNPPDATGTTENDGALGRSVDSSASNMTSRPNGDAVVPGTPAFRQPIKFHSAPKRTTTSSPGQLSLAGRTPVLRVETVGPKAMAVGKASTYRIRLVNQDSTAAEKVALMVTMPGFVQVVTTQARIGSVRQERTTSGSNQVVWDMDRVTGSSQNELEISVKPTENRPIDLRVDWVFRPTVLQARIEVQQPELALAVDGPLEMRFGETKVFKIRLSNPGNGPAENVTINIGATAAADQPNTVGTLAAGESRVMEFELTAKQAGKMQIQATARGDGGLQAESSHEVRVRRAELAVKVGAPTLLYAGTAATYEIRVSNRGDAVAKEVVLQLSLPSGAKDGIGVDKKPITVDRPRWRLGDLTPGADNVYRMQCNLTVGGQNQFVARVQATDKTEASDTAMTTVESIADLKLVVNDPKGPVPVGKDVVYEIQVLNRGSKEATNVDLVAQFSEGIEPSSAKGHVSEIVPGQVVFEPIGTLPAGGQVTVKITARASKNGNHRFRAELKCGDPETKLVSEESTRFYGDATQSSKPQSSKPQSSKPQSSKPQSSKPQSSKPQSSGPRTAERPSDVPTPARR